MALKQRPAPRADPYGRAKIASGHKGIIFGFAHGDSPGASDKPQGDSSRSIPGTQFRRSQFIVREFCTYCSERRHRRDLNRIQSRLEKSWQAQATATVLDQRAQAAEHNHAISSRDPDALAQLQAKLAALEAKQAEMKRINAAYRKGTLAELGWSAEAIQRLQENLAQAQSWEQQPYPGWELSNNSAEIRRTKQRIVELTARGESRPREEVEVPGLRVVYNADPVRIELHFDHKPDEDTRACLKRQGFRWSRFTGAWLAQDTQARRAFVEELLARRQQRECKRRFSGVPPSSDETRKNREATIW
jgi:hypothetical protein